jgi:membrane associated rhomboid family serine protease
MVPIRDTLPTRTFAGVNLTLIAANVVVFALEVVGGPEVEAVLGSWALVPATLLAHPAASVPMLFGHMFLHGSIAHIAGNMLFLWIFGDNVEDAFGHVRYLLFYVTCGLGAAFAQIALTPHSTVPMVGASGAISGVLAAYMVLYPRSPIQVLNPIPLLWLFWGLFIWLPAWLVIIEFFVLNLWYAFTASGGSSVAFAAHVGGFLAGLALLPVMRARRVESSRWSGLRVRRGDRV